MKILLLQDVRKIGRKGEVVSINDGYARNFILPKKLGKVATKGDEKSIEIQKEHQAKLDEQHAGEYNAILDKLKDVATTVAVPANPKGGLFSALKGEEILAAVNEQHSMSVPVELFEYGTPIKETGEHDLHFHFEKRKVTSVLKVEAK